MTTRSCMVAIVTIFTSFFVFAGISNAAPQALGLIATYGGVELNCKGAGCKADFTTFCLQQDRVSPNRGTPYQIGGGAIEVAGRTASGKQIKLSAKESLTLSSLRKHMALRVQVPQTIIEKYALVSVSINVKKNVVLLPKQQAGDRNLHTPAEVAILSQSMRKIGTDYVDSNKDRIVAARILGSVINGLPERGEATNRQRQILWNSAIQRVGEKIPANGINRARGIFDLCKWASARSTPNLRHCLENHHDEFIRFLNSKYWKASKPVF